MAFADLMGDFKSTATWKYIKLGLWSFQIFLVFIVLLIEFITYCVTTIMDKPPKMITDIEMETTHETSRTHTRTQISQQRQSGSEQRQSGKLSIGSNSSKIPDHLNMTPVFTTSPIPTTATPPTPTLTPAQPSAQSTTVSDDGNMDGELNEKTETINDPKSKDQNKRKNKKHIRTLLPIISYIFYIGVGIGGVLDVLNFFSSCWVGGIVPVISYLLGKTFMYYLFIYRLYHIYSRSMFRYNIGVPIALALLSTIYCIGFIFGNIFTVTSSSVPINGIRFCSISIPFEIIAGSAGFDLIMTATCCILFVRPLTKLSRMSDNGSDKIRTLVVKYIVLTFMAVLTTSITMAFIAITDLESLASIDIVINSICMMLFNHKFHKIYKLLCCIPITISKCFCCCCHNNKSP